MVPNLCEPKDRFAGERAATGARPTPAKLTFEGLPGALCVIESVPLAVPAEVGVKVTFAVQLVLGARKLPQVVACANGPDTVVLLMNSVPVPVLLRVTGCGALLVPTSCPPNHKLFVVRVTAGGPGSYS